MYNICIEKVEEKRERERERGRETDYITLNRETKLGRETDFLAGKKKAFPSILVTEFFLY